MYFAHTVWIYMYVHVCCSYNLRSNVVCGDHLMPWYCCLHVHVMYIEFEHVQSQRMLGHYKWLLTGSTSRSIRTALNSQVCGYLTFVTFPSIDTRIFTGVIYLHAYVEFFSQKTLMRQLWECYQNSRLKQRHFSTLHQKHKAHTHIYMEACLPYSKLTHVLHPSIEPLLYATNHLGYILQGVGCCLSSWSEHHQQTSLKKGCIYWQEKSSYIDLHKLEALIVIYQ